MRIAVYLFLAFLCISVSSKGGALENGSEGLKVAFVGTGKKPSEPEKYDPEMLAKIFRRIKEQKPDIIFFTGNLIQGLEESTSPQSIEKFKNNLQTFSNLVKTYIGDEIPLYPVMGNHTFVNSEAVAIFQKHFNIKDPAPLEPYQLAYSVALKNTAFTVLATGDFERKFRGYGYFSRSMPILDWIEKNVRTGGDDIDFRFVVTHEPVFSSEASGGIFAEPDHKEENSDHLWNVLKQNRVLGYFCSHELIYDRSNHHGVWQIVSGGVGDPKKYANETNMFSHFVLLSIPKSKKDNPSLKAIDVDGNVWDEFVLMPVDKPVHHLRISQDNQTNKNLETYASHIPTIRSVNPVFD